MGLTTTGQPHAPLSQTEEDELPKYFPTGNFNKALFPLVSSNIAWRQEAKTVFQPQAPEIAVGNCGMMSPEIVHDVSDLGYLFSGSSQRGNVISKANIASLTFPLRHLKDDRGLPTVKVLELMAHDCVFNGICHTQIDRKQGQINTDWQNSLQLLRIPGHQTVGDCKMSHTERIASELMAASPQVFNLVDQGELLIALSHYDNTTGRVSFERLITSRREGLGLSPDIVAQVANGCDLNLLPTLNPALKGLHTLSMGNSRHILKKRELGNRRIRFIIDACADSRTAPEIVFLSSAWEIESLRGAGNVIDAQKITAIRRACGEALTEQQKAFDRGEGPAPLVVFIEMSHTRCGAIEKTLKLRGQTKGFEEDQPILDSVWSRLGPVLEKRDLTDRNHLNAARLNAISACLEIANFNSEDGRAIKQWMRQGKLQVVPAVYRLKLGCVEFYDPIPQDTQNLGLRIDPNTFF